MMLTQSQPELFVLAETYTEADREADRALCRSYFQAWTSTLGRLDGLAAGHPAITFAQFEDAAERLARPVLD